MTSRVYKLSTVPLRQGVYKKIVDGPDIKNLEGLDAYNGLSNAKRELWTRKLKHGCMIWKQSTELKLYREVIGNNWHFRVLAKYPWEHHLFMSRCTKVC